LDGAVAANAEVPNATWAAALSGLNLRTLRRSDSAEPNRSARSSDLQAVARVKSTLARKTNASTLSGSRSKAVEVGTRPVKVEGPGGSAFVEMAEPEEIVIHRIGVRGALGAPCLGALEFLSEPVGETRNDLVLHVVMSPVGRS
jgi:hypothetical protein